MEFNASFRKSLPPHSSFFVEKPYQTPMESEISAKSSFSNGLYQNVDPLDKSYNGQFFSNPSSSYDSHFYDLLNPSKPLSANGSCMPLGSIGSNSRQSIQIPNFNLNILFQEPNGQPLLNGEGYLGSEYQNPLNGNLGLNDEVGNQSVGNRKDKSCKKGKKESGVHSNSVKAGVWSEEEDSRLIKLVEKYGAKKWAELARMLKERAGKQCRERYLNHLRPNIKKERMTEEEELKIVAGHKRHGSKWVLIAKELPGKTENSIKNHFNATKRKLVARHKEAPYSYLEEYILEIYAMGSSTAYFPGIQSPDNIHTLDEDSGMEDNEQVIPNHELDEINNYDLGSFNACFTNDQSRDPMTYRVNTISFLEHKDQLNPNYDTEVALSSFDEENMVAHDFPVEIAVKDMDDEEFLKTSGFD